MACVKICVVGPESTGKSTLSKTLAKHFKIPLVEEQARHYLENLGRKHNFSDLEAMAKLQLKAENLARQTHPLFVCDTDLTTLKIWAQDKYSKEISFVEKNYLKQKAGLYLLCFPDLVWQPDPLREDEHRLMEIYLFYVELLTCMDVPYVVIKGKGERRNAMAINAVSDFLKKC